MSRLTKELKKRGIVFEADDLAIMRGAEYDIAESFFTVAGNFIITIWSSAVLDPIFKIYDCRTLKLVGTQNVYPDYMTFGDVVNKWDPLICFGENE